MWKGIEVRGNGPTFFGRLEMVDCNIEDAQYAILPKIGSVVTLSGNTFTDNWVGIHCLGLPGGMPALSQNTFQSAGNLLPAYFGQMPVPGTKSLYGIHMKNSQNLAFGGTAAQVNYFNLLKTAVLVENCVNTEVRTCVIQGSNFGYLFQDGSIGVDFDNSENCVVNSSSFQYLGRGIKAFGCRGRFAAEGNGPFTTFDNSVEVNNFTIVSNPNIDPIDIRIHNNFTVKSHFGTCIKAHHIHGSGNVSISNNTGVTLGAGATVSDQPDYAIEFSDFLGASGKADINFNDIVVAGINDQAGGILISNVPIETFVWQNDIICSSSGFVDFGILGAQTVNTYLIENTVNGNVLGNGYSMKDAFRMDFSESSILCCNHPDKSDYAVTYLGSNSSDLANTDFKKHFNRLYLFQVPALNIQYHNGNDWRFADANKLWDAIYEGNNTLIFNSAFFVDPILIPDQYSKINVVNGTQADKEAWFIFEEGERIICEVDVNIPPANSYLCGNTVTPAAYISGKDEWSVGYESNTNLAAVQWEAQRQLFDKLVDNSSLISHSTAVSNFYTAAATGAVGAYKDYSLALRQLHEVPSSISAAYQAYKDTFGIKSQALKLIEANWSTLTPGTSYYDSLLTIRNELLAELEPIVQQLVVYDSITSLAVEERLSDLIIQNAGLPGSGQFHENERAINHLILMAYLTGEWAFDTTSRLVINEVASQCPLTGGRAVYTARNLQSSYQQPDWSNDNCLTVGPRFAQTENQSGLSHNNLQLSPVPATDRLEIKTGTISDTFTLPVVIYDLSGRIVFETILPAGTSSVIVDVAKLKSGLYCATIVYPDGTIRSQKFTISK